MAMRRTRWIVLGLAAIALLLAGGVAVGRDRPPTLVHDFVRQFDTAIEIRPAPEAFVVLTATLDGVTRRAIRATDSTRIVFRAAVPPRAELRVSLGVPEDARAMPGDGILLRLLLARGETDGPLQYYVRHLNPHRNRMDRGWQDVTLNLSEFAGDTVRVFLNTNFTPGPDAEPGAPTQGLALWGEPRIVAR